MTSFHLNGIFKDPCTGTEDLTERDLGRVYSGSEFKGIVIMARRAQGQEEREAAGRMASTVKKQQWMLVLGSLSFSLSFLLRQASSTRIGAIHIQAGSSHLS